MNLVYKRRAKALAAARAPANQADGGESGHNGDLMGVQSRNEPKKGEPGVRKGERYLIHDFSGVVKVQEMMLVVGRPGSGCTTFLKALAGLHNGYAGVEGEVLYGSMQGGKHVKPFRSDLIFIGEEDVHDANLLVGRTLDFALRMNTPADRARLPISKEEFRDKTKGELLKIFGLSHTNDTKVGDQYIRGVSGESYSSGVSGAEGFRRREETRIYRRSTHEQGFHSMLGQCNPWPRRKHGLELHQDSA